MLKLLKDIYERRYKTLMIFSFAILILALVQIGVQYYTTGDFINRGVTLKGGSTITITETAIDSNDLKSFLKEKFPKADISVRTVTSAGKVVNIAVDSDAQETEEINNLLSAIIQKESLTKEDYSVEVMGSSLGQSFFKQTITAIIAAFLLMAIVVLIYFRKVVPAFAVVLCAFSDITVSLAIFNLTGIKLSTAGVAAFLMLVGYSVDTDMVLSTRMLRRKEGPVMERVYSSIKTGLTMTTTTLVAVIVALIFVQSEVIKQIMLILLIGLLVDVVMTYIQNVGVIRLYLDRVEKKGKIQAA
ncbi:MAG: MMPL family transporter [Nanoarchaeota archaeon]